MVYKKYIIRNGRRYGPYLYESRREGNTVVTRYIEGPRKKFYGSGGFNKETFNFIPIAAGFFLVALLVFLLLSLFSSTGNVVLDVNGHYKEGGLVSGKLRLVVQQGELVPKDSKVVVSLNEQSREFLIYELVEESVVKGDFFVQEKELSGSGDGYGIAGSRTLYPEIDFKLLISDSKIKDDEKEKGSDEGGGEGGSSDFGNEKEPGENGAGESSGNLEPQVGNEFLPDGSGEVVNPEIGLIEGGPSLEEENLQEDLGAGSDKSGGEVLKNKNEGENENEAGDGNSNGKGESGASEGGGEGGNNGVTGAVVSEGENGNIVSGKVSKNNEFAYSIGSGEDAEIVSGSVRHDGISLGDSEVKVRKEVNEVRVSTEYFVEEAGFGEEFIGNKKLHLQIDLDRFGINASEGVLKAEIIYEEVVLASGEKEISVEKNESVPEENETIPVEIPSNETEVNWTIVNESVNEIKLLKNIPLARLGYNDSYFIELSEYFSGAESYGFAGANIAGEVDGSVLTLRAEEGFRGASKGKVIGYSGKHSLESNEFSILVSSGAISIVTLRNKVVVGEPVKWTKNITLEKPESLKIELPSGATNISVRKINYLKNEDEYANVQIRGISGNVISGRLSMSVETEEESKIISFFKRIFGALTGRAVVENSLNESLTTSAPIELTIDDNATNYMVEYYTPAPSLREEEISRGKRVVVSGPDNVGYDDIIASVNLSGRVRVGELGRIRIYWFAGENVSFEPKKAGEVEEATIVESFVGGGVGASDEELQGEVGKNIVNGGAQGAVETGAVNESLEEENVSLDVIGGIGITGSIISDVNESAFGFENLGENENMTFDGTLNVSENGYNYSESNLIIASSGRQEVPFDAYDLDGDGFIDYIEWVVPHLSEQTFEIIEISKAEHLDENRTFVEDVYEYVKAQDDNWTLIPSDDYLRVTFEQNLTRERDITIYARIGCKNGTFVNVSGMSVPCEIYQKKLRLDELRGSE